MKKLILKKVVPLRRKLFDYIKTKTKVRPQDVVSLIKYCAQFLYFAVKLVKQIMAMVGKV